MSSANAPQNALPIDDAALAPYLADANQAVRRMSLRVLPSAQKPAEQFGLRDVASGSSTPVEETVSIVDIGKKVSQDDLLPSEGVFRTLSALRKGYQIGRYLADQYSQMSGLDSLVLKNKTSRLVGIE